MLHVIAGTGNPSPTNGIDNGVEQTGVSGDDRLWATARVAPTRSIHNVCGEIGAQIPRRAPLARDDRWGSAFVGRGRGMSMPGRWLTTPSLRWRMEFAGEVCPVMADNGILVGVGEKWV